MSLLPNLGSIGSGVSNFYNGVATQSLRLNRASNADLTRTQVTGTSRKKWTISVWVKRGLITTGSQVLLGAFASSYSDFFYFDSNDRLEMALANAYNVRTTSKFRDPSAWYHVHCIVDAAQGSNANKLQIRVNGVLQTLEVSYGSYPADQDYAFNNNNIVMTLGGLTNFSSYEFDGYMSEFNYVDGATVAYTNFGETKNGIWIAKEPVVSDYGNNGFRLQFANTGEATTGEGTTTTTNIGDDSSGSGHNFAVNNIDDFDCVLDSPENNFATLNALDKRGTVTIAEGSLKATLAGNGNITATIAPASGKWYWEVYLNDYTNPYIGVQPVGTSATGYSQDAVALNNSGDIFYDQTTQSGAFDGSPGWANTNIISVAYDVDNNKIWWALNGQFYSANASSESTIAYSVVEAGNSAYDLSSQVTHGVAFLGSSADNGIVTINFGQDASFAGVLTGTDVGDETDGEGFGLFKYAPPSGFLALCTANLPEPTIGANSTTQAGDYFNTVLYEGTGYDSDGTYTQLGQDVVVGFKPDWVWIKNRDKSNHNHSLFDSNRGATKRLMTNYSNAEGTEGTALTDFDVTGGGFTLGVNNEVNENDDNFVSWNWKANGGTTSTISVGDVSTGVPSIASTVQANTTAGFSIVTYTGDNASSATLGHGLGVVPAMIIVKMRNGANHWAVYHQSLGNTKSAYLSLTQGPDTNISFWNNTSPTSSIFTIGTDNIVNASNTYVAYCFAEVEGYSKFGLYTGNSSDDGAFVFLGFKPAWVMIKSSSAAGDFTSWTIYDNKRKTFNDDLGDNSNPLYANKAAPEGERGNGTTDISTNGNSLDFLSNGFKCRDNANEINQTNTYIYMAFAEQPFKYANAE